MKILILVTAATAAAVTASFSSFTATAPIPNRLIDYAAFQSIVDSSKVEREKHRLTESAFCAAMSRPGVVVLDARSADKFRLQHIKGAVSLPFTDFTAETLAAVLPAKTTTILIYCNNNFFQSPVAFASKMPPASLNLATYTSLKAYGYDNIYELGPLLDARKTAIPFEGTAINASR